MGVLTLQRTQVVRSGTLAYGSRSSAPDLRAALPTVKQVSAHTELFGEFGDRFAGSQKFHGLRLELLVVSFAWLAVHQLDFRR